MDKSKASTLRDMVKYVATDIEAFTSFVNYLSDEYLDPEAPDVETFPTMILSRVAEAFEMDAKFTFTNWFQHEELGHLSGRVSGLSLNDERHRLRIATVFILEDILSDEVGELPLDTDAAVTAFYESGHPDQARAILAEFYLE